jgi:protein phosphatase
MENFKLYACSDGGVRGNQQDSFWASIAEIEGTTTAMACVCDGMGGLQNGKEISMAIKNVVRDYMKSYGSWPLLGDAILQESHNWFQKDMERRQRGELNSGSGTTCTAVCLSGGEGRVYHIGDSRVYHYDCYTKKIQQITKDHTVLNGETAEYKQIKEWMNADPLTDPDAADKRIKANEEKNKYKSKLTRCLGYQENPYLDEYSFKYSYGDLILVCSDGFWHNLKSEDFIQNPDGSYAIEDLPNTISKIIARGERDNITAVLIKVVE